MGIHSLDFNPRAMRDAAASAKVQEELDAGLRRKRDLQPRRDYIGASGIGGPCERAIQFEFAGAPREREIKPDHLRKIDFGHMTEEWARWEFKNAGFDLLTCDKRTRQPLAFSQASGRFKGHADGGFFGGPDVGLAYPFLWEHKGTGSKTFNAVIKDGLKKAKPQYYTQFTVMQEYLFLPNVGLLTITNLDTGEQEHLPIKSDPEEAQRATDRAVRIIKATDAGQLLPRPFKDPAHFVCKGMCDFPARCWSLPQ